MRGQSGSEEINLTENEIRFKENFKIKSTRLKKVSIKLKSSSLDFF